jgi:hypothetical protein
MGISYIEAFDLNHFNRINRRGEFPTPSHSVIRWGSEGKVALLSLPREGDNEGEENQDEWKVQLTPVHRLRQLEPALFFKGQMTSLLASVTENELVSELRGGMVHMCSLSLSL